MTIIVFSKRIYFLNSLFQSLKDRFRVACNNFDRNFDCLLFFLNGVKVNWVLFM